ncbi:MAG: hypothetical protein Q9209_005262 [Squamulea sp. 1 TL-2023]
MAHLQNIPAQAPISQSLINPAVYSRFLVLMQHCPGEIQNKVEESFYEAVFLPGTIYPCGPRTARPIFLCLSRHVSSGWKARFWSENTFVFDAGHSLSSRFLPRGPQNPFYTIRKLHIAFGIRDLEDRFELIATNGRETTEEGQPYLADLQNTNTLAGRGSILPTSEILSLTFPCSLERNNTTHDIEALSELLVYAWISKFHYATYLRLTNLTLDFTGCTNPVNEEFLGNDVAQNVEPFQHQYPDEVRFLPEEMKVQLEMMFRDTNNQD